MERSGPESSGALPMQSSPPTLRAPANIPAVPPRADGSRLIATGTTPAPFLADTARLIDAELEDAPRLVDDDPEDDPDKPVPLGLDDPSKSLALRSLEEEAVMPRTPRSRARMLGAVALVVLPTVFIASVTRLQSVVLLSEALLLLVAIGIGYLLWSRQASKAADRGFVFDLIRGSATVMDVGATHLRGSTKSPDTTVWDDIRGDWDAVARDLEATSQRVFSTLRSP
jgi:hypothetical protein